MNKILYLILFILSFYSVSAFSIREKFGGVKIGSKMPDGTIVTKVGGLVVNKEKTVGDQRLIDKISVFRKLFEIFSSGDNEKDNDLKKILRNNIVNNPFYFGSPCDLYDLNINHVEYQIESETETDVQPMLYFYDKDEGDGRKSISGDFHCQKENHLEVPFNPTSNVVRAGLMLKTCGDILFPEWSESTESKNVNSLVENSYMSAVLEKVCGTTTCNWNKTNIQNAIHLFYPFLKKYKKIKAATKFKKFSSSRSSKSKTSTRSKPGERAREILQGVYPSTIPDIVLDDLMSEFGSYDKDTHRYRFLFYTMCIDPNWH